MNKQKVGQGMQKKRSEILRGNKWTKAKYIVGRVVRVRQEINKWGKKHTYTHKNKLDVKIYHNNNFISLIIIQSVVFT